MLGGPYVMFLGRGIHYDLRLLEEMKQVDLTPEELVEEARIAPLAIVMILAGYDIDDVTKAVILDVLGLTMEDCERVWGPLYREDRKAEERAREPFPP